MTNRREFLQIGVTATALPLASRAARAAGVDVEAHDAVPLYAVIYDTRFADSVELARRSEALGFRTQAIEGDMTRFWYDELYHRWKRGPAAIAGLTAHGPLFCFDQLARDQGMRVVFRGEHRPADGGTVHEFSGPATMLAEALAVGRGSQRAFGARMAEVLGRCPRGRNEISSARTRTSAALELGGDDDALYSWVIAPAVRA